MKEYKHYIFDFDGTICNLEVDWNNLRKAVHREFSVKYHFPDQSLITMIDLISRKSYPDRVKTAEIIREFEQPGKSVIFQKRDKIIDWIYNIDYFYIISNNLHSTVGMVLKKLNLISKCRLIIGIDDVPFSKPSTESFSKILEFTGDFDKSHYIYTGDSENDRIFSDNCGIDFIDAEKV